MAARYSKAYRNQQDSTSSISRVYAQVNQQRPPDYWDYEALDVQVSQSPLQEICQ